MVEPVWLGDASQSRPGEQEPGYVGAGQCRQHSGLGTASRHLAPRVATSCHPGRVWEASRGQEGGSRPPRSGPVLCFNRIGTEKLVKDCCHWKERPLWQPAGRGLQGGRGNWRAVKRLWQSSSQERLWQPRTAGRGRGHRVSLGEGQRSVTVRIKDPS